MGALKVPRSEVKLRKIIIAPVKHTASSPTENWLKLEDLATVEVTSELRDHPIEDVFSAEGTGWRAASPGPQTMRLVFDQAQRIHRIWLVFEEPEIARTQEFLLRWSSDGRNFHDIVRQQWNFSVNSAREIENYTVELSEVSVLELIIVPDNRDTVTIATLSRFFVA